ncbi:MAG: NAD(+) synthase [Oscillospiraceae bacterium]|nr:NAD(+) synthase [Oscillospiraceae bacterium]
MNELLFHAYSPELKVGDCGFNAAKIIVDIKNAEHQGADVALFPELSLTSCSCGDLFAYRTLHDGAMRELLNITESTKGMGITVVVGLPVPYENRVFNCAAVLKNGEILAVIPRKRGKRQPGKMFDFADGAGIDGAISITAKEVLFQADYEFILGGHRLAVVIGDEIEDKSYEKCTVLNPSANVEAAEKYRRIREAVLRVSSCGCAVVTINPSFYESTADYVFSGYAAAVAGGEVIAEKMPFSEGFLSAKLSSECKAIDLERIEAPRRPVRRPFLRGPDEASYYDYVLKIQAHGLARRLMHVGAKKLVLGVSGGLDSTLALIVCCRAADILGRDRSDIIAVSMPSFGSTGRTKNNARRLSEGLGVHYREIDITDDVLRHLKAIGHDCVTADAAFENAQARERTQILMDICNIVAGLQIGTGDLSEIALGFMTYGGDQMSMYGVNASVPKTLVRALVIHCADTWGGALKEILYDISDTPISPELLPVKDGGQGQHTEDIVGPYELHDFFIWNMFVEKSGPKEIYSRAAEVFDGVYDKKYIVKCMREFFRRFFALQFKRSAMPEGPAATEVTFSQRGGLMMEGDMSAEEWLRETDSIEVL